MWLCHGDFFGWINFCGISKKEWINTLEVPFGFSNNWHVCLPQLLQCVVPENIPTPPMEGFFGLLLTHPSGNSNLASYFSLKTWLFWGRPSKLLEFPMTFCREGRLDIFWNCTHFGWLSDEEASRKLLKFYMKNFKCQATRNIKY